MITAYIAAMEVLVVAVLCGMQFYNLCTTNRSEIVSVVLDPSGRDKIAPALCTHTHVLSGAKQLSRS